jgi:two-component system, LytTR family, response regulator AlgR
MDPLRTLIVDDEPLAIERMQILCAEQPALMLVGTAQSGSAAVRMIAALAPDVVFLDISMPDQDGIAVACAIASLPGVAPANRPAIIFVTAFAEFAVEAFDLSATDYLLKPVTPDRLARAVERVRIRRATAQTADPLPMSDYAAEFWVPHRAELVRIAATDIDRIEAERDYMRLHVGARSYLMHQTITALETRLDPQKFIRLHRSVIVRKDMITRLGHDKAGAWHAELADGQHIRIGRTHLAAAKAMVGR